MLLVYKRCQLHLRNLQGKGCLMLQYVTLYSSIFLYMSISVFSSISQLSSLVASVVLDFHSDINSLLSNAYFIWFRLQIRSNYRWNHSIIILFFRRNQSLNLDRCSSIFSDDNCYVFNGFFWNNYAIYFIRV